VVFGRVKLGRTRGGQRIAIYGGSLEAGTRPGGGWRVRATIPLEQAGEPAAVSLEGAPA
jgi:hypothetical protein